jgi:hypothetical protein
MRQNKFYKADSLTKMNKHFTTVNSILIYVTAALLTLVIHETGHFVVENLWHFNAVMHPNYGSYSGVASDFQKIIIATAGPLVSLIQGILSLFILKRLARKGVFSLFILWFSLHGLILFFGYLVCSPFFIYGDTGQVFYLLHFPIYATIIIALASVVILIKTLNKLSNNFHFYGQNIINRKSRLNQLLLFPLIIGGIITLSLQLPVPNFLLLFAGLTTPLMFLIVYGKLKDDNGDSPTVSIDKLSISLCIVFIFTVVIVRLLV